jgi:uncharacterized membrane protein
MKNTTTNKIIVIGGITAGVAAIAYYANSKNKKFAIIGAALGAIVAVLVLPKILKPAINPVTIG